ncbi:MAG TPA: multifunctional oxoglutarate decarboxylase/oxoglutarate dehydrogenase thiamine pyrophosphate-binding subunit/dihydrolipoyllysine-residue succinyltransferase subunit, partial [Rhodothermales bacterium]|nr:multifunctional oxoglutarate decarboxylase/oxoglutarate dehydrogenase thiamine pyrophosphate-binding subunit/dihydrolipoyllysine-residue succinyltransferase subunit [Rhodothermales bacterium]
LRGPSAKIVENMEASLGVPTATSVRAVPVKLMSENRKLINDYQRYVSGEKVSFTHLIAWAVVKALHAFPNMNTTIRHEDGTLQHVIPRRINLGLAIDIERRGKRSLLVPNIKGAEQMNFAQFLGTYNNIVRRARDNKLEIADFAGTTATLTNPGMIGTTSSVPRLMPGQGVIVAAGSIGYPPEYFAFAPEVVSKIGISEVMTVTSTYDHRVIQGAESGAFLQYISELLLGKHDFYSGIFGDLCVPYQPYSLVQDNTPQFGEASASAEVEMVEKQAKVLQLIRAYRVRGHLLADVNPLGYTPSYHPELDPARYGLSIWDLDRKFYTGGLSGRDVLPLRDMLDIVRQTYTHKVGIEFMHISDPTEKRWLQERIEPVRMSEPITPEAKRRILQKLNAAEAFEKFLHTKYIGHKRFSLEGAETTIPILDTILSDAADQEVQDVVIGMAHRGRLNVLANILNKPYEVIFSEFEGSIDPNTIQGSGDVKYHLGAKGEHEAPSGAKVRLTLASNPSHLEAVDPVVEGMVRAKQDALRRDKASAPGGDYLDAVIPLLIHGDAAFVGQGVVAETLNLSQLRGYKTGGTIHLVINNQIGFTTTPTDARSSTYATDLARMIQAPIFHVNGDDPESCVRVARLALDYRQVFNKDVVVDLLCYRVHGHNEADEPMFTQPILYQKIEAKRSVRKLYTETLLRRGEMPPDEAEQILDDYRNRLQEAFDRTKELPDRDAAEAMALVRKRKEQMGRPKRVETGAPLETLQAVVDTLNRFPPGFHVHKKLARQFERRGQLFEEKKIDWAFAEALAFGSLLVAGDTIRLSGQDSRRATFSQRHSVVYDQVNGDEYLPLNHIKEDQGKLLAFDSLLSEYAVCGFEYGYSVADSTALVVWEAQFGDFANGAQIIFDQFVAAAEEKWGQRSGLVVLLPHSFEGQGPEHSSARLERFLQLCAEDNLIVANFTTPANYFHALRRQVLREVKKPLVVMAPKSLLRHPMVVSAPEDFTHGTVQELIPADTDPARAERLVFCSGKVYYDLLQTMQGHEGVQDRVAIARLEQFYPFPEDKVRSELERYRNVKDVLWVQEEPANMGAWTFVRYRFDEILEGIFDGDCSRHIKYVGRAASASPATGSAKVHQQEQERITGEALGL